MGLWAYLYILYVILPLVCYVSGYAIRCYNGVGTTDSDDYGLELPCPDADMDSCAKVTSGGI
jgi:hypothetical protein